MKKTFILCLLSIVCFNASAQDKAVKAEIYGFVRNYFTYDSRSCVQSNEGLFNMLPNDIKPGTNGEDLNAIPSVRFLSMTTRFGLNVTGPEIWGAKSTAKIESDFCGASSGTAFNLRIRQAYTKLAWEHSDLLVGQAWHPMAGDLMPEVFSLATGAPFNPFNRSPQVRYNYTPVKGLSFTAAALYQYQYGSVGLDGKTSNTYSRYALVPELFVGVTAKGKHLTGMLGANASTIAPRVTANDMLVDERLVSYSFMASGSLKVDDLSVRAKAVYGQNTSHMQQPTGFGIVETFDNGVNNYENMQLGSAWITMMYGKKLRYGFFAGWLKNYGSAGKDYKSLVVRNNLGMDQAYRFSPIVTYKVENMQIGLEYEHTATAYGDYQPSGMVTNTHWVANNRVCMMVKYDF
ncbi:MAG: hypothetical protein J6S11_08265 [Bacteroidaceae bacterium]|nr:hypothetical protein [Bacteroidaceae bacterium]MBO7267102.1 hypothetical protein [Bacteroidaceae bacterium]